MTTNLKQKHKELLEQAQALLDKAKEMESLIDEEESIATNENIFGLVKEQGEDGDYVYFLNQDNVGDWGIYGTAWVTFNPTFKTEESAEAWKNVIEVMLELRCQEGVVERDYSGKTICFIAMESSCCAYVQTGSDDDLCLSDCLSPSFSSEEAAQKAIDNIGEERIIKAIKTLEGIKK